MRDVCSRVEQRSLAARPTRGRATGLALAAALMMFASIPVVTAAQGQTSIAILVDYSRSFAPLNASDKTALSVVADVIEKGASGGWSQPLTVFVASIGTSSLFSDSPCGPAITYRQTLVNKAHDQTEIRDRAHLHTWLSVCVNQIIARSHTAQAYTDISGALTLASSGFGNHQGRRLVFVLSDFAEDLPRGSTPTILRLARERIVMLWRPDPADAPNPNRLFNRLRSWEDRLKHAGAAGSCAIPVSGVTFASVAGCVQ